MTLSRATCLSLSVSLIALAAPAMAERLEAEAVIEAVTLFPQGARVTRSVTVDAPAGRHEIVIPGLPLQTDPRALRVTPVSDLTLGAVNLATARQPVTQPQTGPEVAAAEAEVERLITALREEDRKIEAILLRVAAANEQIAFLRGLSTEAALGTLDAETLEDIRALTRLVGEEVLAARQEAFAAEQEADVARRAREDVADALAEAQMALAALTVPDAPSAVLTVVVDLEEAGPVTLDISTIVAQASWAPVYDLSLDTETGALTVDRGVVVSQASGEDWADVALTLSTARPGGQSAPSQVYAPQWSIVSEDELALTSQVALPRAVGEADGAFAPQADARVVLEGQAVMLGATLTYDYAGAVDIRNGVEALRLTLGQVEFDAEITAVAVPARDASAYLVAGFDNTGGEILLPGEARLVSDGALVGYTTLPLLAAGDDLDLGFGPIDGLRLTRSVPVQSEGETGGFITTDNRYVQETVLELENLTGRAWDVLLREALPYSVQDDLTVEITASPSVDRVDPEGQRGIVEWDLTLAPGEARTVTLGLEIEWPSDHFLLR